MGHPEPRPRLLPTPSRGLTLGAPRGREGRARGAARAGGARGRLLRAAVGEAASPGNPWGRRVAPGGARGGEAGGPAPPRPTKVPSVQPAAGEVPAPGRASLGAAEPSRASAARSAAVPGGLMPRCPAGAMDEGPVDLRTRPKAAGPLGAALPLRKRPLRAPSPEPAAPRGAAGLFVTQDPLRCGSDTPAVPAPHAPHHGLPRPEALYYPGEWPSLVRVGLEGIGSPERSDRAHKQI